MLVPGGVQIPITIVIFIAVSARGHDYNWSALAFASLSLLRPPKPRRPQAPTLAAQAQSTLRGEWIPRTKSSRPTMHRSANSIKIADTKFLVDFSDSVGAFQYGLDGRSTSGLDCTAATDLTPDFDFSWKPTITDSFFTRSTLDTPAANNVLIAMAGGWCGYEVWILWLVSSRATGRSC